MTYAFYILAFLAVSAAAGVLLTRQLFHGALMLLISLLCIAGIYVVSMAELVAITQILVYAGGVVVIIIFGIMLTTRISGKPLEVTNNKWFAGILVGISLMTLLISLVTRENFGATGVFEPNPHFTIINQLGIALMTDYLLPFEVAGILLLISLAGAAVSAATRNNTPS
ncbi:MAG TPA: NADH-quinone oxidoreductase subunit J [Cyclobacteriaceae bacterium]|nr:NADH-quinone oxidoreductase subunit J [Cyclobacteriaceae bacterium]